MKYLFLKGNSAKKIYYDMSVTLGDKCPSYSTVKNWVARCGTGHFSTKDEERSGRPTQVTIPENVDTIHSMILNDRRISTKKIAGTLTISRERVGYIIHEILGKRKLSAKWSPMSQC
jgi:transposase